MKKIDVCSKDSVQLKKLSTNLKEKIKIIGSDEGIALIEEMIINMETSNDLEIISKSELLENKGENRRRKFYEVNIKLVED